MENKSITYSTNDFSFTVSQDEYNWKLNVTKMPDVYINAGSFGRIKSKEAGRSYISVIINLYIPPGKQPHYDSKNNTMCLISTDLAFNDGTGYTIDIPKTDVDSIFFKNLADTIDRYIKRETNKDDSNIPDGWISVEDDLPEELETVFISNGKGWTSIGCLGYMDGHWLWAESNGLIYQEDNEIISECEIDDIDVKYWHRFPKAIVKQTKKVSVDVQH